MPCFGTRAQRVCVAVILLAGCSAGQSTPAVNGLQPDTVRTSAHRFEPPPVPFSGLRAGTRHTDHRKSWRSPRLKIAPGARELFVSDFGSSDVYIFGIPSMTLEATLTGFDGPQGLCSDDSGDVWITNTYTYQIFEYSHGGSLLNTLTDPSGLPVSCAWDKKTGNLAVTNIYDFGASQPAGEILVYPDATGTPTAYTDNDIYYYYSAGYDLKGNLYVDGTAGSPNYRFVLGELPAGASSASTVSIGGGTIYFPGGVQWDNSSKELIVGDQDCGGNPLAEISCAYGISVVGSTGTITGSTPLNNVLGTPACDVIQAVRIGLRMYGSDIESPPSPYAACASAGNAATATYRWLYPGGGNPTGITAHAQNEPDGTAISN